jgi:hypothetical protein
MDKQRRHTTATTDERADDKTPKHEGDVLGLSDADPSVEIPHPPHRGDSSGRSTEPPPRRSSALGQSKGATGIDMGAGGTGTDIEPAATRRPDPTE